MFLLRRRVTFAITALAVVALAGGAYAATRSSGTTSPQAFLNDVARRLNVTPQKLGRALRGAFFDRLAAEVAAGRLTQSQADAIKSRVLQSGSVPLGLGPGGFGRAYRFGWRQRPNEPFGFRFGIFRGARGELRAAASYLGITTSKLLSDLRSGTSLAQIAAAQGKTASGLVSAMTAAIKARLDKAVALKMITSAQEQRFLSHLSSILRTIVSRTGLIPPRAGPGFGGAFPLPPPGSWNGRGGTGGRANGASFVAPYGGGLAPPGRPGTQPSSGGWAPGQPANS